METPSALAALASLAQESRLAIFRALVEAARRWREKPRHAVQDFESLPR